MIKISKLSYGRPCVIPCISNEANPCKEENGSKYTIHNQCFNLFFCATGAHEYNCEIDEGAYAQHS